MGWAYKLMIITRKPICEFVLPFFRINEISLVSYRFNTMRPEGVQSPLVLSS